MANDIRPMKEFREAGLLWYVNRVAFHPRGYALALDIDSETGDVLGWTIYGDGTEPWYFSPESEDQKFRDVELTLFQAKVANGKQAEAADRDSNEKAEVDVQALSEQVCTRMGCDCRKSRRRNPEQLELFSREL